MTIIPLLYRRKIFMFINLFYNKRIFSHNNRKLSLNVAIKSELSLCHFIIGPTNRHVQQELAITKRNLKICSNTNKKLCWNCTRNIESTEIFCKLCSCLQPFDTNANLFEIIGMKRSFNLNMEELKHKYRNLQSILHPDKFSSKTKILTQEWLWQQMVAAYPALPYSTYDYKEQELSEEFSSLINKAYTTLLDPLERGLYLLELQNVTVEENAAEIDRLFLMEIMELNEELENESRPEHLHELNVHNKEKIDALVCQVEKAFSNKNEQLAKELLTKMKYFYSIEKKIKEIKQKLNIPG